MCRNLILYTKSQKKHTMNSLTSSVIQGQAQVPPGRFILDHENLKHVAKNLIQNFCYFTWTQTSEYRERSVNNFGMGFLPFVNHSTGKMKCTTKFIDTHSSQKETQLPTVHFY